MNHDKLDAMELIADEILERMLAKIAKMPTRGEPADIGSDIARLKELSKELESMAAQAKILGHQLQESLTDASDDKHRSISRFSYVDEAERILNDHAATTSFELIRESGADLGHTH
jgi:hypothetical protein